MRVVAHVDMDAFFASVEERMNPHLAGRPIAVGGDPKQRRGVIAAANYPARKYGLHAGMPTGEALRLCPELTIVEGNPQKYVHTSLQILEILKDYTPIVEPFSIDEAFLDLTASPRLAASRGEGFNPADPADVLDAAIPTARAIQRAILRKTGLGATVGIAPNKYIAKMASGVQKPRGLTVLTQERYREHFWPLSVKELWGIGEKTRLALDKLGIATVGQLARFPREFLTYHFGMNGDHMREAAWGRDDGPVVPYYEGIPLKSMGHEITLSENVTSREKALTHLLRLSDQVGRRMRQDGYVGRVVTLKIRDTRFKTITRQRAVPAAMNDEEQIYRTAIALLDENWDGRPLRLLGVSVSGLASNGEAIQPSLFDGDEHRKKMTAAVDSLRDRFGDSALMRAGALE
ncbi:MAG TPA: DNA polymerase IV [Candidatus Eisenbacteria bacterium]|nr:DNA polymerase IV [Candidatus Eisenbacteria bacterium]